MTYHHLSHDDKVEIAQDRTWAFEQGIITEEEFRSELVKLGCNATEIEDTVKQHKPAPPENTDGDFD